MSELKRNRYQRKKVVFGFCGPPKYLRNSLVRTNILVWHGEETSRSK